MGCWSIGAFRSAGPVGQCVLTFRLTTTSPFARAGRPGTKDQGDLRDSFSLRLPAHARFSAVGGLAGEYEEDTQDLQRVGAAVAEQTSEAAG